MADDANLSDELADTITTHAVNVLRVSAGLRATVLAELKKLQAQLLKDLEDHGPNPREAALLKQTNESIDSAYSDISDEHADRLHAIATAEVKQGANLLNHAIGVDVATVGISKKEIEAIAGKTLLQGHYPAQWWDGQAEDLKQRFAGAMRQGMLQGEGVDKLAQRVRGTASLGYTDGIMQASRAQAEALVRTSVQSVANEARLATYRGSKVVKGIQWLSTLDSRTTAICRALDGLQWDKDLKPIGHKKAFPGPIAHWNCRSTQIPITLSWSELSGKNVDVSEKEINDKLVDKVIARGGSKADAEKVVAKTRASMDGQVAAKLDFGTWIATKPESFQDQVLGQQQAQLFRAGKITMKDLTDQGNRPLTVSDLQKLATRKQLVPIAEHADGAAGLSLHQRHIAEDQLATLQTSQQELSTYLNHDTGDTTTVSGSLVTADASKEILENDAHAVVKTALSSNDLLTPVEMRTFVKHDVDDVKITLLNGATVQISGKFTKEAVDQITKQMTVTKQTAASTIAALKSAGLKVQRTAPGTVQVAVARPLSDGVGTMKATELEQLVNQKTISGRAARIALANFINAPGHFVEDLPERMSGSSHINENPNSPEAMAFTAVVSQLEPYTQKSPFYRGFTVRGASSPDDVQAYVDKLAKEGGFDLTRTALSTSKILGKPNTEDELGTAASRFLGEPTASFMFEIVNGTSGRDLEPVTRSINRQLAGDREVVFLRGTRFKYMDQRTQDIGGSQYVVVTIAEVN